MTDPFVGRLAADDESWGTKIPRYTCSRARTHESSTLVIERYPSMEALGPLWSSPEFHVAKTLTVGLVDVDFVVAIEGR